MTVLQGINISLGTTAFVALTSNIASAVREADSIIAQAGLTAYVCFLIFWVAKVFIQNHIGFANTELGSAYRVFQFFITIVCFLLLIVSCQEIANFQESSNWLIAHFAVLLVWLLGLAIRLGTNLDVRRYPWHWAAVPLVGIGLIVIVRYLGLATPEAMLIVATVVLIPAIFDARRSRTFDP